MSGDPATPFGASENFLEHEEGKKGGLELPSAKKNQRILDRRGESKLNLPVKGGHGHENKFYGLTLPGSEAATKVTAEVDKVLKGRPPPVVAFRIGGMGAFGC